jgi:protein-S-isoprenylcysteine O-methyltransferase Ste14
MHRPRPVTLVCYALLVLIAVGLLLAPVLGFVNRPALWFGLPSIMVWMGVLVLLITPVLAVVESTRGPDDEVSDADRVPEEGR